MRLTKIFCVVSVAILPIAANAGSFSLSENSVSGLGTAYAGAAAQAEDASTIFFNPAGVALLEQGEVQFALNGLFPYASFHNEGSRYNLPGTPFNGVPLMGNNGGGDSAVDHALPNFFITQPIFRSREYGDLSVGVGVSVPFGLETDYDPNWVGRYASLRTKLTTLDIQPTIAYRVFDRLSLGASLDVQYASARLTQAIDFGLAAQQPLAQFFAALPAALAAQGVPAAAIPRIIAATRQSFFAAGFVPEGIDGVSEVNGDDWSIGFTLGALFEYRKPSETNNSFWQEGRVGVSYRSAIDHDITGKADFRGVPLIVGMNLAGGSGVPFPNPTAFQDIFFNQSATATLDLPDILRFSIYQRFDRQFAVLGDITWTHWSRLQNVPIVFANAGTPETILNINYDDALRYSIGFEWYISKSLTLRTGFAYDETPIKSAEFRTPRIPDNNRYFLSGGLRWSPTSWMDVDLGYAHLFVDDPHSKFTDNQGHELIGTYDASVDIVSAALTFRWGGPRERTSSYSKESSYRK